MIDKIELSRYKSNAVQGQRKTSTIYPNAYDNLFSNYLNSLYNNSPTHQCIVDDIAQQIVALGLTCENDEQAAKLNEYFTKKKVMQIAKSLLVQESVSLEVCRNPLKDIKAVNPINVAQVRVADLEDETPVRFAYKKDWNTSSSLYSYRNTYINSYNNEDDISLLYYYDSGTFNTPYGRPSYLSAADAIELEIAIYMMHNHGAQNGMFPSMIISKETAGEDADRADSLATQSQVTGAANAGKVITTYYRQGGNAPTFSTPNLTGLDKIYENQYETAEIGILKAHRIPSANLISGLNSKGAGFTSETEELAFATDRMRVKIIEPRREQLLEILKPIFAELEIEGVEFKDVEKEAVVIPINGEAPTANIDEIAIDKEASYNGAQIASALEIMEAVGLGTLTPKQAELFLIQMLQFSPEKVATLFEGTDLDITVPNKPVEDLQEVNESIKNLTGRQMQGIERIVRKHDKGQLTFEQAKLMLKSGYGFTDSDAVVWLQGEKESLSVKLTKFFKEPKDFDDDEMLNSLEGEEIGEEWELVDVREANNEDCDEWANSLIKPKLTQLEAITIRLSEFIKSAPNKKSELDKDYYKIRYSYQDRRGGGVSGKSRRFCQKMMGRTANGVVYRKEDIDKASEQGVNKSFGHKGQNYSLFRYKGGVNCGHYFQEELYRMKNKTDLYISKGKIVKDIPHKKKPKGKEYRQAKQIPYNMPNHGHHPNYRK